MQNTDLSAVDRREFLQGALVLAGSPLCCVTPIIPNSAVHLQHDRLTLSLVAVPDLMTVGEARAVVVEDRKINLIVIHPAEDSYVALDRSCTHGGAQCAYNHRRKALRCTSLNHAEYNLAGVLLHGRTHGNLRTYSVLRKGSDLEIDLRSQS